MTTLWLVNGQSTGVDPSDRGLAYGDGLFETMAVADGRIRWLDLHLSRLTDGCARLGIPAPSLELVRREIAEHCPSAGRAVAKLIVTRGSGARGYRPPAHPEPTRILAISAWPEYPATNYTRGIELKTLELRLGQNPQLAGLKHLCRLEQVLAQAQLRDTGADEGLLLDTDGWVVGGTSSNVFAVRGSELVTPALTRCGVRGVMRRAVLEAAGHRGLRTMELDMLPADLIGADEIFTTNALFGIWPVARLDDHRLSVGPTTRALMTKLGIECESEFG